ncbi:MAG TPA: hypothetical protein VF112_08815 [Candidatus Dormibacteraeota bacterium]
MAVTPDSPADIVEIVSLAELLDHHLVGSNGLDATRFAAQHREMWTAPSTTAASAYLAWHGAYFSMGAEERRWLARVVAGDLDVAGAA